MTWQSEKGRYAVHTNATVLTSKVGERVLDLPGYQTWACHQLPHKSACDRWINGADCHTIGGSRWIPPHCFLFPGSTTILQQDEGCSKKKSKTQDVWKLKSSECCGVCFVLFFPHFLQTLVLQWQAAEGRGGKKVKHKQQSRYAQGLTVGSASCISSVSHADGVCESAHCSVSYGVWAACSMIAAPSSVTHREVRHAAGHVEQLGHQSAHSWTMSSYQSSDLCHLSLSLLSPRPLPESRIQSGIKWIQNYAFKLYWMSC